MKLTARDFTFRDKCLFWALAMALGLLRAVYSRFVMWGDSVSYIEMGQAYFRHDWQMAINSYWSPVYAWLIALPGYLFGVSPQEESTAVHFVNVAIFAFVLFSFEYFLNGLIRKLASTAGAGESVGLEPWALRTICYSLFLYFAINWMSTEQVTPDLVVEGLILIVAGLVIRIHTDGPSWGSYAGLGLILGLGYLTKAVLFPLAFVIFAASVVGPRPKQSLMKMTLGILVFALIAGPYIFVLSRAKGHFTYGEAGRLAYVTVVNGLPLSVHWQANGGKYGTPRHPTRKLLSNPAVFEFAEPIAGSYPAWYDPSYWYDGAQPHFEVRQELGRLRAHAYVFYDWFINQSDFVLGFLILYLAARGLGSFVDSWKQFACIWLPSLVAVGAYALILIERRYVAGFLIVLWMSCFAAVRFSNSPNSKKIISCVSVALALLTGMRVLKDVVVEGGHIMSHRTNPYWEIVQELHSLGVKDGDKVASIGFSFDGYWAHLAGVKIVAEVPESDAGQFWISDPATKSNVMNTFASLGAKAVVCNRVPAFASPTGWSRTGNPTFFVVKIPLSQPVN